MASLLSGGSSTAKGELGFSDSIRVFEVLLSPVRKRREWGDKLLIRRHDWAKRRGHVEVLRGGRGRFCFWRVVGG